MSEIHQNHLLITLLLNLRPIGAIPIFRIESRPSRLAGLPVAAVMPILSAVPESPVLSCPMGKPYRFPTKVIPAFQAPG